MKLTHWPTEHSWWRKLHFDPNCSNIYVGIRRMTRRFSRRKEFGTYMSEDAK
jgi:hypothetical protein